MRLTPLNSGSLIIHIGRVLPENLDPNQLSELIVRAEYTTGIASRADLELVVLPGRIGDIDFDDDVDTNDRIRLRSNWTGVLRHAYPYLEITDKVYADGDIDLDGDIDTLDETMMLQYWTSSMDSAQTTSQFSVPEPSSPFSVLVAFAILTVFRRRGPLASGVQRVHERCAT